MSFVLYKLIRNWVSHNKTGIVSLLCIAIEDLCRWSLDVVARRTLCLLEYRHQVFLDWEGARAVAWVWIQPVLRINTFVFPIVALTAHGCGTVRCYCTKIDSLCTLISRGSLNCTGVYSHLYDVGRRRTVASIWCCKWEVCGKRLSRFSRNWLIPMYVYELLRVKPHNEVIYCTRARTD